MKHLAFILSCVCTLSAAAQSILERTVSLHFTQQPLPICLDEIARQANFEWSYNAAILPSEGRASLTAKDITVREALARTLGPQYEFRENGNYLILRRVKKPKTGISGYISDSQTGKKIPNATVYDRKTLKSATTDANGYYELPVKNSTEVVVARLGYRDTVLYVSSQERQFQKIDLNYEPSLPDTTRRDERTLATLVKGYQRINSTNVRDSLERRVQFSLLPWVGTNLSMSGSVSNDVSLNALVGYSRGNRILEVGGLGNISRKEVSGVQIGGIFNIVSGRSMGWQFAGVWNQAREAEGGAQIAGLVNVASKATMQGLQVAGLYNYIGHGTTRLQIGGLANRADSVAGMQVAGIRNRANKVKGMQIAGFRNRARRVEGLQIGIFNRADTIKGMQIGIFNRSKVGGYNRVELVWTEVARYNLQIKTGSPFFYVSLSGGYDAERDRSLWHYGGGVGCRLGRRLGLSTDLLWRHIQVEGQRWSLQEWGQAAFCVDYRLFGRFFAVVGCSANLLMSDPQFTHFAENKARIAPREKFYEDLHDGTDLTAWWGTVAGVRYRF